MLKYALEYLDRGWSVLPVGKDKKPLLPSWAAYQEKRATEVEVRSWWKRWPNAGIGVVTGHVSGLTVVDIDSEEGMAALVEGSGSLAPTLAVKTQGGGTHLYFKYEPGLPNRVRVVEGVDVRNDGGMVVAPPTKGERGEYMWVNESTKPVHLPPRLRDMMKRGSMTRRISSEDWKVDINEGKRDFEITRRAGKLLQAGMPAPEVLTVLRVVNQEHCKPPLDDTQLQKIVVSISGRENAKHVKEQAREFSVTCQREMLRKYSEDEERWVIKDWLPESGCGLIVAPPGNFKTWLLMALAYSVGTGRDFLNKYPVTNKGPVLVVQQEDPFWMLENRLARMFNQMEPKDKDGVHELDCRHVQEFVEAPIFWHEDRQFSLENKECLESFESKVAELRPRLVLIDPLYSAVSAKDYMALGAQSMLVLKRLRDKYGTCFVIAHHTTVAGSSSEDRSSIWGSQFLNAWLEFGWRMPKGDDNGNIMVRHFKSAAPAPRIRLRFDITEWSFAVNVEEKVGASAADAIEDMILNGGRFSTERDLAQAVQKSPSMVHKMVKKMGLEKDKNGCFSLPK